MLLEFWVESGEPTAGRDLDGSKAVDDLTTGNVAVLACVLYCFGTASVALRGTWDVLYDIWDL